MAPGQRTGVLGGTFDPPHRAHLALAEAARHALSLDQRREAFDRVVDVGALEDREDVDGHGTTERLPRKKLVDMMSYFSPCLRASAMARGRLGLSMKPHRTVTTVKSSFSRSITSRSGSDTRGVSAVATVSTTFF